VPDGRDQCCSEPARENKDNYKIMLGTYYGGKGNASDAV